MCENKILLFKLAPNELIGISQKRVEREASEASLSASIHKAYFEKVLIRNQFSDGSTIYGSSKDEAEELRTFVRGQLRVQIDAVNEELLPADSNDLDCRMSDGYSCFKSGDVRVNEHPSLVGKTRFITKNIYGHIITAQYILSYIVHGPGPL